MENKKLKLDFEMSIFDIVDLNKSFAAAKCLVCYTGRNRNKSDIRKDTIVDALNSMKNIPVVGRYDAEKDDFGGHDLKVITTNDKVDVVNATIPFGVIPESANQWFEIKTVDGEEKECLFTDIVLWKRQHGYQRIAEAGTISESMEINVSSFTVDQDNYCIIDKFEFEALCLLGSTVTPCFENACVQMYSNEVVSDFKLQFSEMLKEFKELSQNDNNDDFNQKNINNEGGKPMDEKLEILKKFNKTVEELDFSIEDLTVEEITAKMEELFGTNEPVTESVTNPKPTPEPVQEPQPEEPITEPVVEPTTESTVEPTQSEGFQAKTELFSATYGQKREAARNAMPNKVELDADGKCIEEIWFYVEDMSDEYIFVEQCHWIPESGCDSKFGRFAYTFDEDSMVVTITGDFEEMVMVWLTLDEKAKLDDERANFDLMKNEFEEYKASHSHENEQVKELISYKTNIEAEKVFSKYEEKVGKTVEFEELKKNVMNYSLDQLKKECIYIVGLHASEFSKPKVENKTIKFSVESEFNNEPVDKDPYGDIRRKYLGK